MRPSSSILALFLAMSLPAAAEEIVLKDGTKIVGHMTALTPDKIEVSTAYGNMQLKRSDIVTISFPENNSGSSSSSAPAGTTTAPKTTINVDEALHGTQYINRTGKFTLTLPAEWVIDADLPHTASSIAGLSSRDKMRFLMVSQEEYTGSLDSYEQLNQLQARRFLGNFEELSQTSVAIDGKNALMVSYRGTLQKNNLPVEFLIAIIPSGTSFTKVTAWCVEPLFHETQPTFEKILNSYRSTGFTSASAGSSKP